MTRIASDLPLIYGEDYPLWLIRHFVDDAGHDQSLVRSTLASFSLSFHEKNRVLTTVLNSFQVEELHRVFDDERAEFSRLMVKESTSVLKLNADAILVSFLLGLYHGMHFGQQFETACIRRMVTKACRREASSMLSKLPEHFWTEHKSAAIVWRHAMKKNHFSWKIYRDEVLSDVIPKEI